MSEKTHSPLPWRDFTDEAGIRGILDAAGMWVTHSGEIQGWTRTMPISQANIPLIVESVNRRVPLPDAEMEAIRNRWKQATSGDWAPTGVVVRVLRDGIWCGVCECLNRGNLRDRAGGNAEFIAHAHQDIPRLLEENTRLLGLLDDLFRDHGANADETPTVQIREENARLRMAVQMLLAECLTHDGNPDYVTPARTVEFAREALGERKGGGR